MNRRHLKNEIFALLADSEPEEIYRSLLRYPSHLVLNLLFSALCHCQEIVRWRSVYCFGFVVFAMAEENLESARVVMRRFLWSLNDESGGIGWGAPESMAEIMCHHDKLRSEYLHMLISYMCEDGEDDFQDGNYIELPMLQRGLLWGVGRLCKLHTGEMVGKNIVAHLLPYLDSPDKTVVGMAIWCLNQIGINFEIDLSPDMLRKIRKQKIELKIFLDNTLQYINISQLVRSSV